MKIGVIATILLFFINAVAFSGTNRNIVSKNVPGAHFVFTIDMDGDGDIDILSAGYDCGKIFWHENLGALEFKTDIVADGLGKATSIYALDIDSDEVPEVVSSSKTLNAMFLHKRYKNGFVTSKLSGGVTKAYKIGGADFNMDGMPDLVTSSFSKNGEIFIFLNIGNGSFKKVSVPHGMGGDIASIVPADIDGDGKVDLVALSTAKNRVFLLKNIGKNSFEKVLLSENFTAPFGLETADMDGDGDMDIVVSTYSTRESKIAWLENIGTLHFKEHIIDFPWSPAPSMVAKDLDGDGDMDIAAALKNHDSIVWYENRGKQNFAIHTVATGLKGVFNIEAVDLDGDGRDEIVAASYGDGTVTWHRLPR